MLRLVQAANFTIRVPLFVNVSLLVFSNEFTACTSPCETCVNKANECTSCEFDFQYLDEGSKTCKSCDLDKYYDPLT